ncbi:hypothetical protein KXW16_005580, partial [Aspergillus fumigatus]
AVVRLLLEKGAAVDAQDQWKRTALLYAAGNGHEAVVRLLKNNSLVDGSENARDPVQHQRLISLYFTSLRRRKSRFVDWIRLQLSTISDRQSSTFRLPLGAAKWTVASRLRERILWAAQTSVFDQPLGLLVIITRMGKPNYHTLARATELVDLICGTINRSRWENDWPGKCLMTGRSMWRAGFTRRLPQEQRVTSTVIYGSCLPLTPQGRT